MVQSRELLDTIVKESKGKDTNAVNELNIGKILQSCPIFRIQWPLFFQLSMESQQVLVILPGQSFPSASSSEDNPVFHFCHWSTDHGGVWSGAAQDVTFDYVSARQGAAGELGAVTLCRWYILLFSPTFWGHLVCFGVCRSLVSCVVVCRCGKPAEPRKDPHAARSEDQCSGQRAQWNFSGNPASHDPSLQR